MEAYSRFHKVLKAVTEHRWIIAIWLVVRQLQEDIKVLGRLAVLARSKRPRPLPILRENLVMMMKIQPSNNLPKNAFNAFRIEAFNHLIVRQHQATGAMIEFRHDAAHKFLIFPGTKFFS